MIRLENVTKWYGEGSTAVHALDRVDLAVPAGEFLTVTGPSGSGKSTLLQLIAGLDSPSSGEISIFDRNIARLSDDELSHFRCQRIGVVFQFFNLLPALTAQENVALPALLAGHGRRAALARAAKMLEQAGLSPCSSRRTNELSGGEMQRVAIARALVNDPAVLLADEPTGNLDSTSGEVILDLIGRANREHSLTVILVTHDSRLARHGQRTIALKDGRIETDRRAPSS